jgi:ketosteroid isomerase-like protein
MFDENIMKVANALVGHCKNHTELEGLKTLYADDAVSVESVDMGNGRETKGVVAIEGKHEWWNNAFEVHSDAVEGPYIHGANQFGVIFEIDATNKETGERSQMKEVAVYTVDNGKISREEFFYLAG